MKSKIRPLAIYLPQYHSIPENDKWWGKGFTEWTNVKKAEPLFKGHNQPAAPHDSIGYYDLGDVEVLVKQSILAKEHGIEGFAYYHYWFNGKRLLNLPIDNMLKSGKPDFPFCLFWANESWSRRWLGEEKDILIEQTYNFDDDVNHIKWLIEVFKDPRYIKVGERPVFIIYRPTHFPDISKTIEIFRQECKNAGVSDPYLIASNSHAGSFDLSKLYFDGILNFEPQLNCLSDFTNDKGSLKKALRNLGFGVLNHKLKLYNYTTAKEKMMRRKLPYSYFPCTFVNWDNSPRRNENGIMIIKGSPEKFQKYLKKSIELLRKLDFKPEENFLFINAWNEWAEGNYLEPDIRNGNKYLEALKQTIDEVNNDEG